LVRSQVYTTEEFDVLEQHTWLQTELAGAAHLQQTLAYLAAVIRLRRVLVDGRSFFGQADMQDHFRRLLDDPWVTGSPLNTSKNERRNLRARPPQFPTDVVVYASDGATRNQGAAADRQSSLGCVRYQQGTRNVIAKYGITLGDVSNNVAEYSGVLENLRHALKFPAAHLIFHVDSMLVANQVNCEWRCMSPTLKHCYEQALESMANLRRHPNILTVTLKHVYREYNSDADGVCNEVLNLLDASLVARPRTHQVCVNWIAFRDVDAEGDVLMGR
jgi:ribonuclease HI